MVIYRERRHPAGVLTFPVGTTRRQDAGAPVGTITDGFLLLDKPVEPLKMDETINHHLP